MKIIKTHRLEIGAPTRITIILVGCGGTGSYAALHLAQLAFAARARDIGIKLIFVDPDTVEPKNVARQNFAPSEVGQPKAATLARRYSLAFGLAIIPVVARFEAGILREHKQHVGWGEDGLTVVVGCVDNTAARRDIREAVGPDAKKDSTFDFWDKELWWLDAGNHHAHGQVLLGNSTCPKPLLSPPGFAYTLPFPSVQDPKLIALERHEDDTGEVLSCAELVERDVQARTINKMMACWIDVFLERLIISRDLRMMGVELDQRSGQAISIPITGGVVREATKSGQHSYPAGYPAVIDDEDPDDAGTELIGPACPECGGDLIEGRNIIDDEELEIYFCNNCNYAEPVEAYNERQAERAFEQLMGA